MDIKKGSRIAVIGAGVSGRKYLKSMSVRKQNESGRYAHCHWIPDSDLHPPYTRTFGQDDEPPLAHPVSHLRAEEESRQIGCFVQ